MKYSIITINYNNREGLRKTIESVINQTYTDFEYIVIDGGSTDGSVEVIQQYADKIGYWVSEPDKGIYNAMNKGIVQAHGDFLIFMNSGDCFYNTHILENMANQCTADIIVGRVANADQNGQRTSYSIRIKNASMFHFFNSTLPHQGSFIKRSLFHNHLYDETLKIVSDWKFFMECAVFQDCDIKLTDVIIADCEYRGASNNMQKLQEEKKQVLTSIMPAGIQKDYLSLSQLGLSSFDMLMYIAQYPGLRKLLYRIMKIIVWVHQKLCRN